MNIDEKSRIEEQLKKILNSEKFKSANKLQQFLSYIVREYCEGRSDNIKQYTIGVEAFSIKEDFDPQDDPIIRITAGKLRRRLIEYYSLEGKNDELIIDIPKGSYIPSITFTKDDTATPSFVLATSPHHKIHENLKISVVPFNNISGDDELDYFADGLAEEITAVLSLYKSFSIVPPIATRDLNDIQTSLKKLKRDFDVRYVLDGSIRKAGEQIRIIARLNDVSDYSMLWTSTYDTSLNVENIIRIQNEIATNVTNSIANEYQGVIPLRVASESSGKKHFSLTTYEAILHIHHYNLVSSASVYNSTSLAVQHGLEKEPGNPMLLSVLAELKIDGYSYNWTDTPELPVGECLELIERALSYDRECAYTYYVWGLLETNRRLKKELLIVIEHLLGFKHSVTSLAQAGWFLAVAGEYEEGLNILNEQLKEYPYFPGWFQHAYFLYHYENKRYDEALKYAKQFRMPGLLWDPLDRAAALVQLDRLEESEEVIQELISVCPGFFENPRRYLNCYLMRNNLVDHVLNGLIKVKENWDLNRS